MKKIFIILLVLLTVFPSDARKNTENRSGKTTVSKRSARKAARKIVRCEERMQSGIEAFHRKKYARAINSLSVVANQCSGEFDNPDSIYYFLGLSYMNGKKPEDARLHFRTIVEDYPHSEFIENTYYYIAYCSYKAAPIIQRDNRLLRRAEREFSAFIAAYPNSDFTDSARIYLDLITDKLLEKEILNAEYYEIMDKFESAVIYYQAMLEDYPFHKRVPEIRLRLARNLVSANRFAEALVIIEAFESEGLFKSDTENLRRRINTRNQRQRRRG